MRLRQASLCLSVALCLATVGQNAIAAETAPDAELAVTAAAATAPKNFYQVNNSLYRSARPTQENLQYLASLGVKTVLDLENDEGAVASEQGWAAAANLTFYSLPMSGTAKPTLDEIEQALTFLDDPVNQPVLVHCHYGSDRTGIVVGAYHIHEDHWTAAQAIADMRQKKYGHSVFLYWWDDVLDQVQ